MHVFKVEKELQTQNDNRQEFIKLEIERKKHEHFLRMSIIVVFSGLSIFLQFLILGLIFLQCLGIIPAASYITGSAALAGSTYNAIVLRRIMKYMFPDALVGIDKSQTQSRKFLP